jgi:hypothetical protein
MVPLSHDRQAGFTLQGDTPHVMYLPSCCGMRTNKTAYFIGISFATATTRRRKSHVVLVCQKQNTFRSFFDTCKQKGVTWLSKSVPKTPSEICLPTPAIIVSPEFDVPSIPNAPTAISRLYIHSVDGMTCTRRTELCCDYSAKKGSPSSKFVSSMSTVYAFRGKGHSTGSATNGELSSAPEGDARCHAGLTRAFLPLSDGL